MKDACAERKDGDRSVAILSLFGWNEKTGADEILTLGGARFQTPRGFNQGLASMARRRRGLVNARLVGGLAP